MLAQDHGFQVCRIIRSALVSAFIVIMTYSNYAAGKPRNKWNKVSAPYYASDKYEDPWQYTEYGARVTSTSNSSSDQRISFRSKESREIDSKPSDPRKGTGKKGKAKKGNGKGKKGKKGQSDAERKADNRWEEAVVGWTEKNVNLM